MKRTLAVPDAPATALSAWNEFEKSGSVRDYLSFAAVRKNESEVNAGYDQAIDRWTDLKGAKSGRS